MPTVNPTAPASGSTAPAGLVEIAAIDFATIADTDFKAGGDGNYTVGGVSCRVEDSAAGPQLEVVGGVLRIGVGGSRTATGGTYNAPRFGLWHPATARLGFANPTYAAWELGASTLTAANYRTVAADIVEIGAPSGDQWCTYTLQADGAAAFRGYTGDTTANITTSTGSSDRYGASLPTGIAVGRGPNAGAYVNGLATSTDAWENVGVMNWKPTATYDPWTRPSIATPSGVIYNLACWNTGADASGQYVEVAKVSIWGVAT